MMSPELQRRLATLTAGQKAELSTVLEKLQAKGVANDLDETDMLVLLDALTAPVPPRPPDCDDLMMVMTWDQRAAIRRLGKKLTARDVVRIAPFLVDEVETMRKVERLRSLPDGGWYAALLRLEDEFVIYG